MSEFKQHRFCSKTNRRNFIAAAGAVSAALGLGGALSGCERRRVNTPERDVNAFSSLLLDNQKWSYDEDHDVYYQLCVPYVQNPVATDYQKLSIFVPGSYFTAEKNGDSYKVELNPQGTKGAYSVANAPIVMPLNCKNFSAQIPSATYAYEGLAPYMEQGVIYVFAGCRGKTSGYVQSNREEGQYPGGAPFTVIDLKSAIRFLRLNASSFPGNASHISVMGVAAAGAIATTLGATGNAPSYTPFLEKAGAALWTAGNVDISDTPNSVCVWNPYVDFNTMDAAYEWLYGQYTSSDTRAQETFGHALSRSLAADYATALNGYQLTQNQETLQLDDTSGGICTDGSYYWALIRFLQNGAEQFFSHITFPATIAKTNHIVEAFPGEQSTIDLDSATQSGPAATAQYASAADYIAALNKNGVWITLNAKRATVRIESIEDYINAFAPATRPVTAYDSLQKNTEENQYFGTDKTATMHFSEIDSTNLALNQERYAALAGYDPTYPVSYQTDLAEKYEKADDFSTLERQGIDNAMSYVAETGSHFAQASVAPHWRIQVGLAQSLIPFTCGFNLSLALRSYQGIQTLDCTPVWEEGAAMAEIADNTVQAALDWLSGHIG